MRWGAFIVAGQAAVGGEPGQGAFHGPPVREDGEALLVRGFADGADGGGQIVGGSTGTHSASDRSDG